MKTRKLALNAVLAAMCAALGALALDLNSIKITFESFPILLGALLFGPLDGLAVGFVGTLLYQLLRYGVSATTLLWILPYALAGLVTGLLRQAPRLFAHDRTDGRHRRGPPEVLVTALNTLVMYIDAKLYGYWFPGFISAHAAAARRGVRCESRCVRPCTAEAVRARAPRAARRGRENTWSLTKRSLLSTPPTGREAASVWSGCAS